MTTTEPIVIKVTTNNEFFGDPSVIRVLVGACVPTLIGQEDRDVLVTHLKDSEATTAIFIEVHTSGSEREAFYMKFTINALLEPLQLDVEVVFTETCADPANWNRAGAAYWAASHALHVFQANITAQLAYDEAAKRATEAYQARQFYDTDFSSLPMPWEVEVGSPEWVELEMVVNGASQFIDRELM